MESFTRFIPGLNRLPLILGILAILSLSIFLADSGHDPDASANSKVIPETIPQNLHPVLEKSCMNCHSAAWSIAWPFRLFPASVYFRKQVDKARNRIDFSQWEAMSPEQRALRKRKISRAIRRAYMPPSEFNVTHPDADLSLAERARFLEWCEN